MRALLCVPLPFLGRTYARFTRRCSSRRRCCTFARVNRRLCLRCTRRLGRRLGRRQVLLRVGQPRLQGGS